MLDPDFNLGGLQMSILRPEAARRGHHASGGWRGVCLCCLGMKGEGGSVVGAGRKRRPQAMKVEGGFSVEVWSLTDWKGRARTVA